MLNMEETEEETNAPRRDRISALPTDIKQSILSSLCMRDALASSSLSSLWRYTWVSLPFLDFGFHFFCQFSDYFDTLPSSHPKKQHLYYTFHGKNDWKIKHIRYVQLLDQIFQIYSKKRQSLEVIKKLSLYIPMLTNSKMRAYASHVVSQWLSLAKHNVEELSCWIDEGRLDRTKLSHYVPMLSDSKMRAFASDVSFLWILLAKGNVTELNYSLDGRLKGSFFTLQNCDGILESKTLTKLGLLGCNLISEKEVEVSIHLPCLKELHLRILNNVDQKMLDVLLHKCGALEKLELWACNGVKALRVPALSKLNEVKVMHILDLEQVEIHATTLQCLTLVKLKINKCEVKVASNSSKNLVELFINGCGISDDFFNNVRKFPNLKAITLLDCPKLKHINISSRCLTRFRVEECPNLVQIELDTPNMLSFRYCSNSDILTLLSNFQVDSAYLLLQCPSYATSDHILWHSKLVALLANFSQSNNLHLAINSKENIIIPKALRDSFCPPLCGVQTLSLTVAMSLTSHVVLQYLDNLLWLSPRPTTIYLSSEDRKSNLLLELEYKEGIKERGSCGCYPAQAISCWRRLLKDFKIVRHRGLGNSDTVRKLLEHAVKKSKATACG